MNIKHLALISFAMAGAAFPSLLTSQTYETSKKHSGDWSDLMKLLPPTTNAILAIDADAFFQSELASKSGWRESHAEHFDRNPTMLPPIATRFVLSTELDTEHFEPTRELAVLSISTPIALDEIRERIEGEDDSVAGVRCLHTANDTYIVPVGDRLVTLIRQSSRQWAAQQVRDGRERTKAELPQLIVDAIDQLSSEESQIVLAVNLKDLVPQSSMLDALNHSGTLDISDTKKKAIVHEAMQIQGLIFSISITNRMQGRLSMVFDEDPKELSYFTQPILLDLLTRAGAVLPEFKEWQVVSRPKCLTLEGELNVSGLRRVLSLLNVESTGLEQNSKVPGKMTIETPRLSREVVEARATSNYVTRVTRLAEAVITGGRGSNLREQVLWTDRSAKAISRMSTRDVKTDAVSLGRQIAYGMLGIVSVFQEADQAAQSKIASENPPDLQWRTTIIPDRSYMTPYGRYYRYRPFSTARVMTGENAIRSSQIMKEELDNANAKAKELVSQIESDISKLSQIR